MSLIYYHGVTNSGCTKHRLKTKKRPITKTNLVNSQREIKVRLIWK